MIRTLEILEELESHGQKRKIKEEILKENQNNQNLKDLCRLAYDWLMPFYITDVEGYTCVGKKPKESAKKNFKDFKELLDKLNRRELTGHDARDAAVEFFNRLSELEAKWYRRVINRDLRIHVGVKTLRKVWPNLVSTFAVQLADKYENARNIKWPLLLEPKYDGFRLTIPCKDGTGSCFTRNGRKKENLQFLADRVAEVIQNGVLDVEIYHDSWNTVSRAITTKPENMTPRKKEMLNNCKLWAFDLVDLKSFLEGHDPTPLKVRRAKLEKILSDNPIEGVEVVPQHKIQKYEEAIPWYNHYLDQGYEGIMLKNPESPYKGKRTRDWLKIKPEETIDAKVVGVERGTGRNADRLGALIVELDDGTRVNVGGGYSDEQREEFWKKREELVGKVIEYKQQKETADVASARFPQFKRMRPDKEE